MRLSIIIAVYNSHKVVIRQLRHFKHMPLPSDAELIIVDDGSSPPLDYTPPAANYRFLYTNDKRPWTQGLARNLGAANAKGEYLLFTDIDHIIPKEAVEAAMAFTGDMMIFRRWFAVLDPRGNIITDRRRLMQFGLHPRFYRRPLSAGVHGNTYAVSRRVFDLIGGYDPSCCTSGFHVGGKYMSEDRRFNLHYVSLQKAGMVAPWEMGPNIYCYPVSKFHITGDNNPWGLFHPLSLEQVPQPMKE